MGKYRKRPIVIEAEQFVRPQGDAAPTPGEMFMDYPVKFDERGPHLIIPTLEGDHRADLGDWIATGVKKERYPIKDAIFKLKYEPA